MAIIHNFWHKQVMLKVSLFAMCLLHNWIPTTYNLIRRRVLPLNAQLCAAVVASRRTSIISFCLVTSSIKFVLIIMIG